MPKPYELLWLRMGDAADYEEYGHDLLAIAEELFEFGIEEIEGRAEFGKFGVEAPGFKGYNYISLYWGDEEGNAYRPITNREIAKINTYLSKLL